MQKNEERKITEVSDDNKTGRKRRETKEKMWCNKCGKDNEDGAKFCKYCGNSLQENLYDYIERAKKNDQQALTEIYLYSSPTIYKVVQVLVKDHDTVNDIIQDTYIKAFARIDQLENPAKLMAWLKIIATNTAKDWLKKSKPVLFSEMGKDDSSDGQAFVENLENERIDQNPELAADEKEVRRLVMEILDQLPEDQRLVVGMFYYEEMSVKDIAVTLELSENTVKSRLSYARKKIKEQVLELEKQGTRLYSVAPFAFFLYLLRAMGKTPADQADMAAMQQIWKNVSRNMGAESQIAGKNESGISNGSGRENGLAGKAAKSVAKTATGTVTRQISMKAVALLVAGTIGAGGITYGIVKHAESLPFMSRIANLGETETERITLQETESETEIQSEPVMVTPTETESQSETQTETEPESQSETQSETQTTETPVPAPENVVAEGSYGDNVQWYLDEEGTLTVNGQGAMADVLDQNPGWFDYADQIRAVVIGKGITRIGSYAFCRYDNLSSANIADTVTEIGDYAFCESNLTALHLPDSVQKIGDMAFRRCYALTDLTIGENSQLEYVGAQAFADNANISSQDILIPSVMRSIKSDAFQSGDFEDTVTFSEQLEELGFAAFGGTITGMHTVYFTGNAPNITDQRIAVDENVVFPDTTTDVYYPEGNATWNGFDFSKLGVNVTPHSYEAEEKVIAIPQDAVTGMVETESKNVDVAEANGVTDTRSLYQAFYEKYVTDENLQVIENEWQNDDYDRHTGYTQDMLLAAYLDDFGGDGNQELLLIRTRDDENKPEQTELAQGIKKRINLELYGMDGQKVTLRQTLQYDSSDWNEMTVHNIEQIAKQRVENDFYLYRYAMYHPSAGSGIYDNTIVRVTDQELIEEADLQYTSFQGAGGLCIVNGEDCYTGNEDADVGYLNSILQPYGLEAFQEIQTIPCIVHMTRDEIWGEKENIFYRDIFRVTNIFQQDAGAAYDSTADGSGSEASESAQNADQGEELFYMTALDHQEGGQSGEYWMPGTTAVDYDSESITFHASFSVGKEGAEYYSEDGFYPYGTYTFTLTPDTQYYFQAQGDLTPTSQETALATCASLNGLAVELKVKDGKVETMTFKS